MSHRTRSSDFSRADSDDLNESQSPETEDKEEEGDAETDSVKTMWTYMLSAFSSVP